MNKPSTSWNPLADGQGGASFSYMKIRLLLCFVVMASGGLAADNYGSYGKSSSTKKKDSAKAASKESATIPGIVIERKSKKGYLGLELVDFKYKLTFYGEDKEPIKADVPRALFRWPRKNRSGTERYLLSAGSEASVLTSPRNVKPPFNFRLFIVLLDDDEETKSETYVVQFRP